MTAVESTPILLVGDHSVSATALEMALSASGFSSVTTVVNENVELHAVLEVAGSLSPGLALVDLRAHGEVAVAIVTQLVARDFRVLLFAPNDNPWLLSAGLKAGAEAIVDRAMSFERLLATLVDLAQGRQLIPAEERAAFLEVLLARDELASERRRSFDALTAREAHVLRCLIDGTSPKQIAHAEGLSISTVRGHIERIFTKLNVRSQREALALARSVGWPHEPVWARTMGPRTGNFPPMPPLANSVGSDRIASGGSPRAG
jgi:two-component system nitrate/nitrite response regulator NarL